jgi:MerR family transcriptional regulator/heat shock protein HspR
MADDIKNRPVYMIGIAAELSGVHPQTLRMYERKGLMRPRRSIKNTRLYSQADVETCIYIQKLTQEMGMNLAGVEKVLALEERIEKLEAENRLLRRKLERQEREHSRRLREVHRSYKREVMVMPKGDLIRRGF